jgi:uncharacterized protein YkwD
MACTSRFRSALATPLLLVACYSGPEGLEGADAGGATTSETTSEAPTTSPAPTSDPSAGPTADPTANPTADLTTGADTGELTTGPIDDTTTGDESTGPPPDPSTTTEDPSTDTGTMGSPDVPDNAYCAAVAGWDPAWRQLEDDILVLVNQARAMGANCGSQGNFGPAGPLTMDPALRCAARKHSTDMDARDFFDHINPDGETPWDRMGQAGYGDYSNAGENIAAGSPDAAGTMDQWMTSDGHCSNIMNPDFEHIGVGYHPGGQYGHLWTQVFGAK